MVIPRFENQHTEIGVEKFLDNCFTHIESATIFAALIAELGQFNVIFS